MRSTLDTIKERIISLLRGVVPHVLWSTFWWLLPLSAILLLPVGSLFFQALLYLEIDTVRPLQMLWLFSLVFGPVVGISILGLAGHARLSFTLANRVKWLARIAVVSPILSLWILFLIFGR
jgi:hypothetical protein